MEMKIIEVQNKNTNNYSNENKIIENNSENIRKEGDTIKKINKEVGNEEIGFDDESEHHNKIEHNDNDDVHDDDDDEDNENYNEEQNEKKKSNGNEEKNVMNIETQTRKRRKKVEINGWTLRKQLNIEKLVYKLKYNRVINNFFFFELKSRENSFSWSIIVISTLITTLNLLNNVETEPFPHYFLSVKISMTFFSTLVTLIAAWMKKQQYIERINIIDRYNQKLNKLIEEVEIQLTLLANDRDKYSVFKEKYQPQITEYLSTSPSISPTEWKNIVYKITVYYPELISQDGITENKLWPWHAVQLANNDIVRTKTKFGEKIIKTYGLLNNPRKRCCCCCIRKKEALT